MNPFQQGPKGARFALWVSVALTVGVYVLPFGNTVGYPLLLLSTFAHELGHGLTSWLVGGSFIEFHLYADGSGVAYTTQTGGRWSRALVAAGGLVGPSIAASLLFAMGKRQTWAKVAALFIGFGAIGLDLFLVRNGFGFVFIGVFGLISLYVGLRRSAQFTQVYLVFLAVQLSLSVFSRADYLFMASARTSAGEMPSDVANIASALFLPYWFWGLVCGGISLGVLSSGLYRFGRSGR